MGQNGDYVKQRHYPMTRPRPFVFSQSNARKGAYYKIMGDLSAASVIQSVIEKGLYIVKTYFIAKYDTAMGLGHKFSQH